MKNLLLISVLVLAGCDQLPWQKTQRDIAPQNVAASDSAPLSVDNSGPVVPDESNMRPADPLQGTQRRTIASLGDPARAGLWMETPLVQREMQGRVRVRDTGTSAELTLIPAPGQAGASSRLSLAAMRALGAPLGNLVDLEVMTGG